MTVRNWHMLALMTLALLGCQADEAVLQPKGTAPKHVMLIRHGEKSMDDPVIHLTSRGAARAAALPSLFLIPPTFATKPAPFPTPDFLIAAKASKFSNRSAETLMPLAKALKTEIDDRHPDKNYSLVVEQLFDGAKYSGKTVLISWHHSNLPDLTRLIAARAKNAVTLKGQVPVRWDNATFDRVWVFAFDDMGSATFADSPQKLLFGDSKK